jgi:hypothetical protein
MADYAVTVSFGGVPTSTGELLVTAFGADSTGVADSSTAIQAAVDSAPTNGIVKFPAGTYKITAGVSLNGKRITLEGYGARIEGTGAGFSKTDHVGRAIIKGFSFNNAANGIQHIAAASNYGGEELQIDECLFNVSGGAWGVYSSGTREPRITNCTFSNSGGGNGIYFKDTVSPFIDKCIFLGTDYSGTAIYYPGTGTGTDAGLVVRDTEILGWDQGLIVVGCDWLRVDGCTIDFNTLNFKLGSQDSANISGNYLGSINTVPALWVTSDAAATAPNYSTKIIIENNTIVGHYDAGATYDCILIDGSPACDEINIMNNNIHFYTRYGIRFNMDSRRLRIQGNNFGARPTFTAGSPVFNSATGLDGGVTIKDNYFSNGATIAGMAVVNAAVNENLGCITEARGEASVPTGTSTHNQAHGLDYTPVASDIQLTATTPDAAAKNPYINAVTSTNIVIGFTSATSGTNGVSWRVRRGI